MGCVRIFKKELRYSFDAQLSVDMCEEWVYIYGENVWFGGYSYVFLLFSIPCGRVSLLAISVSILAWWIA